MLTISQINLTLDRERVIDLPDDFEILGKSDMLMHTGCKLLTPEQHEQIAKGVMLTEPVVFILHDMDCEMHKHKLMLSSVATQIIYKKNEIKFFYMLNEKLPDGRTMLGFYFTKKLNP